MVKDRKKGETQVVKHKNQAVKDSLRVKLGG